MSLDLIDIDIDRKCPFDTVLLHVRDQLHSIASSVQSDILRLYVKKTGKPVYDNEDYQKLTDKANKLELILKWLYVCQPK